jgi:hypothetical protein
MTNERLRNSMATAQLSVVDLAERVHVDPKTVGRWIATGRIPHRQHRLAAASALKVDESFLWPGVMDELKSRLSSQEEIVGVYGHRGAVPWELWTGLVSRADESVDLLAYAALFLWDTSPDIPALIARKAQEGVRIRLLIGDPQSDAVRRRGDEEGIGEGLAARIRLALIYAADLITAPGVELRMHDTTLYNSIFRFDDDMLVNAHVYGAPAAHSPVIHLRRLAAGRLFIHYLTSFETVWQKASVQQNLESRR